MKKTIAAFVLIGITIPIFATLIVHYDIKNAPSLSLPVAYEKAETALGAATNEFHCLNAQVTTDYGRDGDWQFTFYSTNSKPKWVTIEFNGKIHVEDILIR